VFSNKPTLLGQETTSSSLTWGIGYLIVNYHVQEQLHKELDRVIGSDRMVTVSDKQALPFTNAVIMEVQRMANIVSINLPRKAARDVVVNGVSIKKGTVIVPQISVMMIDPDTFDEAKIFNPSRFIDENGNFKPADEVVPFSMGILFKISIFSL
jgi:cytochrome P450 family 33